MGLNDLLFESFVMIKFFPVGDACRQFVQLLQIPDTMGICFGVPTFQNGDKQTAVDQAGDKVAVFCLHRFGQRKQAAVMVAIKLIGTFQEIFFGFIYLSDCNQKFRIRFPESVGFQNLLTSSLITSSRLS